MEPQGQAVIGSDTNPVQVVLGDLMVPPGRQCVIVQSGPACAAILPNLTSLKGMGNAELVL